MPLIDWKDEFKIGIAAVDFEHRTLIDLINDVHAKLQHDAGETPVSDCLGEIYTHIAAHFALEERIMRERRYDQYAEHKADHEHLLDELRDIMDEYEVGAMPDHQAVLGERLSEWFGRHFRTMDARLHAQIGDAFPR